MPRKTILNKLTPYLHPTQHGSDYCYGPVVDYRTLHVHNGEARYLRETHYLEKVHLPLL